MRVSAAESTQPATKGICGMRMLMAIAAPMTWDIVNYPFKHTFGLILGILGELEGDILGQYQYKQ